MVVFILNLLMYAHMSDPGQHTKFPRSQNQNRLRARLENNCIDCKAGGKGRRDLDIGGMEG